MLGGVRRGRRRHLVAPHYALQVALGCKVMRACLATRASLLDFSAPRLRLCTSPHGRTWTRTSDGTTFAWLVCFSPSASWSAIGTSITISRRVMTRIASTLWCLDTVRRGRAEPEVAGGPPADEEGEEGLAKGGTKRENKLRRVVEDAIGMPSRNMKVAVWMRLNPGVVEAEPGPRPPLTQGRRLPRPLPPSARRSIACPPLAEAELAQAAQRVVVACLTYHWLCATWRAAVERSAFSPECALGGFVRARRARGRGYCCECVQRPYSTHKA